MTSLIGFLSLASALTATSSALSCMNCTSSSSTCKGNRITCHDGFVCGSVYTRGLGEGERAESLTRECTPSPDCDLTGTMSIDEEQIAVGISCCSSDGCTPPYPTFPTNSPNPNGVICPSYISDESTQDYPSDFVHCTGDENICILRTEIRQGIQFADEGCATMSLGNLGSLSYNTKESSVKVRFFCTSGGISAHKVILTPAIVCLLLLKVFL